MTESGNIENFLNQQENLDIVFYFSRGKSYREIARKIRKDTSFVKSRIGFLRENGLMPFGRWNVNVNALGMTKTLEFCSCTEGGWNKLFKRDFFLSYFSQVVVGKAKYLAMYTFPEGVKNKIGSEITSWYYTCPHLEAPFSRDFDEKRFFEVYEEENNRDPLPPRKEKIRDPEIIDVLISKYAQFETDIINVEEYTKKIERDIGNYTEVSRKEVEKHLRTLENKNVIYPIFPLDFGNISYSLVYCITSRKNIFRIIKTLNKFNIMTGISFLMEKKAFLHIQCPPPSKYAIISIFDQLDRDNEVYFVTKIRYNRGLPYKYYLEKYRESNRNRIGR